MRLAHPPYHTRNVDHQRWHYVHFHRSTEHQADSVCRFLIPAMEAGHCGVVLATTENLAAVRERGAHFGLDLQRAEENGQFLALDAKELLERIMVDGSPDAVRFQVIIGDLLRRQAERFAHLHIYGELVALLWDQGNKEGTMKLEELWNNLGRMRPFQLLCGYPHSAFTSPEAAKAFADVCRAHTHVLDDPSEAM